MSKMTEQEIIEFAKQNDYCHGGLKRRHPEVAEWMDKHRSDCLVLEYDSTLCRPTWTRFIPSVIYNFKTYRLRPDYESPSLEDQAKASLDPDYTFVGYGKEGNREKEPSPYISGFSLSKWNCFQKHCGWVPYQSYAVRNDAPDEIWQRFGLDGNPHKPAEKKWWFGTSTKAVICQPCNISYNEASGWLEVTKEYADYLSNKPDGECELRIVKKGDKFKSLTYNEWGVAAYDFIGNSCKDRGYRWCKVKQAEKKWWFRPSAGIVCGPQEEPWCDGWVEVTAEYAYYLRNKPDGEWELRKPEIGDKCMTFSPFLISNEATWSSDYEVDEKHPVRWCKIKPKGRWVEYDVVVDINNEYAIKHPSVFGGTSLNRCANIKGFGGIQFRRHEGTLTDFLINRLAYIEDGRPCDPVKVRFWEGE